MSWNCPGILSGHHVKIVGNGQGKVVVGQGKVREFQTQKMLATLVTMSHIPVYCLPHIVSTWVSMDIIKAY